MGDRTHFLDRKPGKFGVTVQEDPNKGKHGIGAILERKIITTTTNNGGAKITTVVQASTIKIKDNIFGEEFASLYGTRENQQRAMSSWKLTLLSGATERFAPPVGAAWIYIGLTKVLPKAMLAVQGYQAATTKYDSFRYERGGKIEEKLVITTTLQKDGHGIEKIKRTYSAWRKNGKRGFCNVLENSEKVF
jgi:hypothetical protein